MRKRIILIISIVLTIAMITGLPLTGCKTGTPAETTAAAETTVAETASAETTAVETTAAAAETSKQLESVRISLSSKLVNLDITQMPWGQPDIITGYYISGRLFRLNMDWSLEPEMAESLEVSDDGLKATVKLKEGLLYSDGTPVKAEDVLFAFERQRDVPGHLYAPYLKQIDSVEAIDDQTVVFNMSVPYVDLQTVLGMTVISIHPKSLIESDPDYFLHPVSAGPYVIKDWTPGDSSWVLEENPNYIRGPMAVKKVEFVTIPDQTSRVLQLVAGDIDFVYDVSIPAIDSFPAEVTVSPAPLNGMYHVCFNLSLPEDHPLRNAKVRQAISLAINRAEINDKAFGGISIPADSFQYQGPEEALRGLFGAQDIEAAKALLAETPFADGFTVELQTYSQRAGWKDAALVIAENLSEIGITAEVLPVEDAVAVANLQAGTYEMIFSGNASPPMGFFRNQFYPGSFWTDAMHYNNPEVTKLLDEASSAVSWEDRINKIHEAQRLAYEDMPLMPICDRVVAVASRIDPDILYIANMPPGTNPWIATLSELED